MLGLSSNEINFAMKMLFALHLFALRKIHGKIHRKLAQFFKNSTKLCEIYI